MNSLKEVFSAMQEQDHVKEAQAQAVEQYGPDFAGADPELVKQAADYDTIGRILAHNVFSDMVKQAMDEEMPNASEEEKDKEYKKTMALARGEKSEDDEDEDEDEDKKKKSEGEGEGGEEKHAQVKAAILQRMSEDPQYVSELIAKYQVGA